MKFVLLLILFVFCGILVNIQTVFFLFLAFLSGVFITFFLNRQNRLPTIKIYILLFSIAGLYMLTSYVYMINHGYDYLLAFDIVNWFHPQVESFLDKDNYIDALKDIWSNYSFYSRFQYGYFSYATFFGFIGKYLGANFYLCQNISVLFLYSFVGVILFRMIVVCGIEEVKAYKYSIIISLCSILFFFSFQTLRDIHVLLFYLLAIYITLDEKFNISRLIWIVFLCFACCTFRLESGLFLFSLLPLYLFVTLKRTKKKSIIMVMSIILLFLFLIFAIQNINYVNNVVDENSEYYIDDIAKGSGVIATLQKIPILGGFLSIIYNAFQPIPFWSRLWVTNDAMSSLGGATYNIMNFPRCLSAFFNCVVITHVFFCFSIKRIRNRCLCLISTPMKLQLWVGLFFLYLQSAVVEQRRLMAYYCVFYILFVIIRENLTKIDRKKIMVVAVLLFTILQIIGALYF